MIGIDNKLVWLGFLPGLVCMPCLPALVTMVYVVVTYVHPPSLLVLLCLKWPITPIIFFCLSGKAVWNRDWPCPLCGWRDLHSTHTGPRDAPMMDWLVNLVLLRCYLMYVYSSWLWCPPAPTRWDCIDSIGCDWVVHWFA